MARVRGIGTAQHARRRAIRSWNPLTILGVDLELWLRSDSLVGVSGGLVASWGDLSGKGNNFSESTFRLIYNAGNADWGGKPSIDGDATKRFLVSDSASSTWKYLHDGTGCFYLEVRRLADLSGNQLLAATAISTTDAGVRLFGEVSNNQRVIISNGTAAIIDTSIGLAVDTNYYGSFAYLEGRPGNEWRHDLLGTSVTGDTTGAPVSSDPADNLHLNTRADGGGTAYLNGSTVEIISASVYPTDQQFVQLKAYLDIRYGF